jgi:hypothetical protein
MNTNFLHDLHSPRGGVLPGLILLKMITTGTTQAAESVRPVVF